MGFPNCSLHVEEVPFYFQFSECFVFFKSQRGVVFFCVSPTPQGCCILLNTFNISTEMMLSLFCQYAVPDSFLTS